MLEKIILSEDQISNLYKKQLFLLEEAYMERLATSTDSMIDFKGGFEKKILWLHRESAHPYIHDNDFEMLTKILEACRLTWHDIALVNLDNHKKDQQRIIETLFPHYIIISTGDHHNYESQQISGVPTLYTHSFHDIRSDKNLKVRLWQALKIFFELK